MGNGNSNLKSQRSRVKSQRSKVKWVMPYPLLLILYPLTFLLLFFYPDTRHLAPDTWHLAPGTCPSGASMNIIETHGLTKTYGTNGVAVHALRGIDLKLAAAD